LGASSGVAAVGRDRRYSFLRLGVPVNDRLADEFGIAVTAQDEAGFVVAADAAIGADRGRVLRGLGWAVFAARGRLVVELVVVDQAEVVVWDDFAAGVAESGA